MTSGTRPHTSSSVTHDHTDHRELLPAAVTYIAHRCLLRSGLLVRPEHSETKAKTETRECETEIEAKNCYKTETKNYETETESSPVKSHTRLLRHVKLYSPIWQHTPLSREINAVHK